MSRLQEITESLKVKFSEVFEKIKETEIYQQLSDRYESLSPAGQKGARAGSVMVVLFILLAVPLSQFSNSKEFVTSFESKRQLIRDLFKTYRESNQTGRLSPAPDAGSLTSTINSTLQTEQLLPEQIVSVGVGTAEGRLIPAHLMSTVLDVKLAKLNLRQVVDIGSRLAGISQSVKLKDMAVIASSELAGYFDVTYKLYALNVPAAPIELPAEPEGKSKKKKSDDKNDSSADDEKKSKTKGSDE